jgi:CDP-paratose 2-epimerase
MTPPHHSAGAMTEFLDTLPILITGGAGFIGTNLAHRLAAAGRRVLVFDNLSRPGVQRNLAWLRATHGDRVEALIADVRDAEAVRSAVGKAAQVFHFAAQVAVTSSIVDPVHDFDVNVRGTLNLLEAMRDIPHPPSLVFTSTNKVYGALGDIALVRSATRCSPKRGRYSEHGVDERRPLDFHSPYGCSKGAADQYVLDYARSYGLPALVFRMSCIYGPHQCGTEDQGWVAHFLLKALADAPITIFGDGRQVRDILHVDDLVEAFLLAQQHVGRLAGEPFNIGGGAANAVSLLDVVEHIARLNGGAPEIHHGERRLGDQAYYVSDCRKFSAATQWHPRMGAREGIAHLYHWLKEQRAGAMEHQPHKAAAPQWLPEPVAT